MHVSSGSGGSGSGEGGLVEDMSCETLIDENRPAVKGVASLPSQGCWQMVMQFCRLAAGLQSNGVILQIHETQ